MVQTETAFGGPVLRVAGATRTAGPLTATSRNCQRSSETRRRSWDHGDFDTSARELAEVLGCVLEGQMSRLAEWCLNH